MFVDDLLAMARPWAGQGTPKQATGPRRQGAGVGVGMLRGIQKID